MNNGGTVSESNRPEATQRLSESFEDSGKHQLRNQPHFTPFLL